MTLETCKSGYGAELELITTNLSNDTYQHRIQGVSPREFVNQSSDLSMEDESSNGEEEWDAVLELKTGVCQTIQEAAESAFNRAEQINTYIRPDGVSLRPHPCPVHELNPAQTDYLTERYVKLMQKDSMWAEIAPLTAVCAFQVTSSNFMKVLREYQPTPLSEYDFTILQLNTFIDILRYFDEKIEEINRLNKNSERVSIVSRLLSVAKSDRFKEEEMRYNFQPKSTVDLVAILLQLCLSKEEDTGTVIFDWKSGHHIYSKMKGKMQTSEELEGVFHELIDLSYEDKLSYLGNNPKALDLIINSMNIVAFEYRPFDTTLDAKIIQDYSNFIYEAEMAVICTAHSKYNPNI